MPSLIILEPRKGKVVELNGHDDIFTGMNAQETIAKWIAKRNQLHSEYREEEE